MGGRGRGRGGANSGGLTFEQLQSMGVTRGDMGASGGASGVAPPPLFPKLEARPLPLHSGASLDYMLILKSQFLDYLHDSPSYVQTQQLKCDVERYSDKYKVLSTDGKSSRGMSMCWANLPAELRPHHSMRKTQAGKKRKGKTAIDIDLKLKKLEQKEQMDAEGRNEVEGEGQGKAKGPEGEEGGGNNEEEDAEVVAEEEDPDEEMDDGTDYVDNYFDNGEGFEDEDENLDDGPVY